MNAIVALPNLFVIKKRKEKNLFKAVFVVCLGRIMRELYPHRSLRIKKRGEEQKNAVECNVNVIAIQTRCLLRRVW